MHHPALTTRLHPVPSHADAVAITGTDPWVRWALPADPPPQMWRGEHALAVERRGGRRHSLTIIPLPGAPDPPAAVGAVIAAVVANGLLADLQVLGITVPQGHLDVLEQHLPVHGGGDWAWLWTRQVPQFQPAEAQLVHLDDHADATELTEFSAAHSPTAEGEPGTGRSELWIGARDETGALIAAGAMQRLPSGVPYLAGIVVHTAHRGYGLGSSVTAALTRAGLAQARVCALSMYSDNPAAARTYHRLGYRTAWRWASRSLTPVR